MLSANNVYIWLLFVCRAEQSEFGLRWRDARTIMQTKVEFQSFMHIHKFYSPTAVIDCT